MEDTQALSLPHVRISLAQSQDALHRAVLDLCNEALGWGLGMDEVQVCVHSPYRAEARRAPPRSPPTMHWPLPTQWAARGTALQRALCTSPAPADRATAPAAQARRSHPSAGVPSCPPLTPPPV